MNLPTRYQPPSEADTLLAMRDNQHALETACARFEELWEVSNRGEKLPPEAVIRGVLREIVSKAELLELNFISLGMLRDYPHLTRP